MAPRDPESDRFSLVLCHFRTRGPGRRGGAFIENTAFVGFVPHFPVQLQTTMAGTSWVLIDNL